MKSRWNLDEIVPVPVPVPMPMPVLVPMLVTEGCVGIVMVLLLC